MIRISKPVTVPDVLQTRGVQKTSELCQLFAEHEAEYRDGTLVFTWAADVYGHATVKQALIAVQHRKCCFCESRIGADGDVEHFRPKAACCQSKSGRLLRPGYYWLAYDWDNLLFACGSCNQRHKRNLFPLHNPTERADSHTADLARERPLFLNPAECDPQEHIGFRQEIAFPINNSPEGRATINALGLNRENLNERRRDRLAYIRTMRKIVELEARYKSSPKGRELLADAENFLREAVQDDAEFAAMARNAM